MKIAVLVSGGVDSSVALKLLKDQGHELTAFYLQIWLEDELSFLGECPWEEDLGYIREICERYDVPVKTIPLQKQYHERVVAHVLDELKQGRTPSPDIHCNQRVKFGAFFDAIDDSFDKIASGHYAQIIEDDGHFYLKQAPDPVKDQTYFLSTLSENQLSRIIFPIGHLLKKEVRDLAEDMDLPNKARKDSQGVCFLGKIKYSDFVKFHLGEKTGQIIELETNEAKGQHNGVWFYTIGQRQGIGLHGGPWYVVKKDLAKNIVYISHKSHREERARDTFSIFTPHWINNTPPDFDEFKIKLRHGPQTIMAKVIIGDKSIIKLETEDPGVASGQSVIFYKDEICYGSAVIDEIDL